MRSIGIRASPSEITYSIIEENYDLIVVDKLIIPQSLIIPEQLKFIRNTVIDIIYQNNIKKAGIRITESTANKISIERVNFEAIIQELFASSLVEKYFIGQISNISAKLSIKRTDFKKFINNELDFDRVGNWSSFSEKQRESILTAIVAIDL